MILLDKVTKRFGPKILFENVSIQFDPGKRYGVTGANGAVGQCLARKHDAGGGDGIGENGVHQGENRRG